MNESTIAETIEALKLQRFWPDLATLSDELGDGLNLITHLQSENRQLRAGRDAALRALRLLEESGAA